MKLTEGKQGWALPASQTVALLVAGLLLGLSLAVRWKGVAVPPSDSVAARGRAVEAIHQLEREQEQLKAAIVRLREDLAAAQRHASQQTEQLAHIGSELEREQIAAGLVPLRGPGVTVQLDDSSLVPTGAGTNVEAYIIHEYDLRDVVNLLWNAGAEAISVNGERLVATTSIYCVGSTIMVNDTRLSPPYQVRAIGDRKRIEALLDNPAYLTNLRQRIKGYGVQLRVSWADAVDIPAFAGTFRLRFSGAGEIRP